jgi:hypothetical protein
MTLLVLVAALGKKITLIKIIMIRLLTCVMLCTWCNLTFAQEEPMSIKDFQGIWQGNEPIGHEEDDRTTNYLVYKDNKMLYINTAMDDVFSVMNFGLWSGANVPKSCRELKTKGTKYYQCMGSLEPDKFHVAFYSDTELEYANNTVFIKLALPDKLLLRYLKKRGIKDNRDYIKELLGISFKKIKEPKVMIYSSINQISKAYLLQNDEVEVLETKDSWIRIRYYGTKVTEGWIKANQIQ